MNQEEADQEVHTWLAPVADIQSINQVYCTGPCHTHTINLTNKNKR